MPFLPAAGGVVSCFSPHGCFLCNIVAVIVRIGFPLRVPVKGVYIRITVIFRSGSLGHD